MVYAIRQQDSVPVKRMCKAELVTNAKTGKLPNNMNSKKNVWNVNTKH